MNRMIDFVEYVKELLVELGKPLKKQNQKEITRLHNMIRACIDELNL